MEKTLITTVETNVTLAEKLIEEHINNMHHAEKNLDESGHVADDILWESFENINWCCEDSPAEGTIEISFSEPLKGGIERISVPVTTNFVVVCTKEKDNDYKITWSYSLS